MRQERYQEQSSQSQQINNSFEKVQIFIEGQNFRTKNLKLGLQTYVQIDISVRGSLQIRTLRTEQIKGTVSPKYTKSIEINHYFEKDQRLCFKVFESGKLFAKISDILLIHIIQGRTPAIELELKDQENNQIGKLNIRVEAYDVKDQEKYFEGQLKFFNIPQQGFCLPLDSQVFFQICRKQEKLVVYRSQIMQIIRQNDQNGFIFKNFSIQEHKLCRNNEQMVLQVNLYYKKFLWSDLLIGCTQFNLRDIQKKYKYVLKSEITERKNCQMIFIKAQRHGKHTLVNQFIKNELSCCCAVAIDFTQSNGHPSQSSSLHNINNIQKNKYIECLRQCLEIVWQYDQDKNVPLLGFGARLKNHSKKKNEVSHFFPLNMNWDDMNVHSISEAIETYKSCLDKIKFGDPTYFRFILKWAQEECKKIVQKGKNQYMVLFFFTDGQIHDKNQVQQLLIECNYLPISIIIIGIGQADFTIMYDLDDDEMMMTNKEGKRTQRDSVQFVQYKKHKDDKKSLVTQVLQQIPRQILDYINLKQKYQRSNLRNSKK